MNLNSIFIDAINNFLQIYAFSDAITVENLPTTLQRNANWVRNLNDVTTAKVRTTSYLHVQPDKKGNHFTSSQNKDIQISKTEKVLQVRGIQVAQPLTGHLILTESNGRTPSIPFVFIGRGFVRCQHIRWHFIRVTLIYTFYNIYFSERLFI